MPNSARTSKTGTAPAPRGAAKGAARTAGSGREIDLGALVARKAPTTAAGQSSSDERRAEVTPRRLPVSKIAPNPLNREVDPASPKVRDMAASLRQHGQLSSIPVVSRMAFVAMFSEFADEVSKFPYVQVNGGYRRAAALLNEAEDRAQLGEDQEVPPAELDIVVRNELVSSREEFVAATAAENLDRNNYNPIEEARAVALVVRETGTQDKAAERLQRSKGWVTHRMNLLTLAPEVQEAVAAGEIPLREARTMHSLSTEEQLAILEELRAGARSDSAAAPTTETAEPAGGSPETAEDAAAAESAPVAPTQGVRLRATRFAAAIKRLGQTPPKIADALVGELPRDAVSELITELQARLKQD